MNKEKSSALLKWMLQKLTCDQLLYFGPISWTVLIAISASETKINTAEIGVTVDSLQQLSDGCLLLKLVKLIDQDYQLDNNKNCNNDECDDLFKVICFLEYFYQQSLASFISPKEIMCYQNVVEIGKVLSLLLCCAVQGENVSLFVEKITELDEDIQLHLKVIIEAVLKEVDGGRIHPPNISNVLLQSESEFPDNGNDEFISSPMSAITSPISLYNSPIKALMASPQMQSRQSLATISKLYKRLNQLQITINNLQRTQSDLERDIEGKNKEIESRDLKINSMLQEVAKVRGLEEEVQSLSAFEVELKDVKHECERMKKKTEELENYKQQFLKLEKEFSDLVAENNSEKVLSDSRLSELRNHFKERISQLQVSVEEKNINNNRMKMQLLEASSIEASLKNELRKLKTSCKVELEKLRTALDESNRAKDKLCRKNDENVLCQIARESELKSCFKEQEASLNVTIDQLQLQNSNLQQDIEQLRHDLDEKEKLRNSLESDLAGSRHELNDLHCKLELLQTESNSLQRESQSRINGLNEEKNKVNEALQKCQEHLQENKASLNDLKGINEALAAEKIQLSEKNVIIADSFEREKSLLIKARVRITELESDLSAANESSLKDKRSLKDELDHHVKILSANDRKIKTLTDENKTYREVIQVKDVELKTLQVLIKGRDEEIAKENRKISALQEEYAKKLSLKDDEINQLLTENEMFKKDIGARNVELEKLQMITKEKDTGIQQGQNANKELEESYLQKFFSKDDVINKLSDENRKLKDIIEGKGVELERLHVLMKAKDDEISVRDRRNEELQDRFRYSRANMKEIKERVAEISGECDKRLHFYNFKEKQVVFMENNSALNDTEEVKMLGHLPDPCPEQRPSLKTAQEKSVAMLQDSCSLGEEMERPGDLTKEVETLQSCLKSSDEQNQMLKGHQVKQLELLSKECEELRIALEASDEQSRLLKADNSSIRNELNRLESLSKDYGLVKSSLEKVCEEKTSLLGENKTLIEKVQQISCEASLNKETLFHKDESFKSRLRVLQNSCSALRDQLKETKDSYTVQVEDIGKVQVNLRVYCEKLLNERSQFQTKLYEKERTLVVVEQEKEDVEVKLQMMEKMMSQQGKHLSSTSVGNKDSEGEELRQDAATTKKGDTDLEGMLDGEEQGCLKQQEKVEQSKRQLESSVNKVWELSQHFQNQNLENENCKFREEIATLEKNASDLEKKLTEEQIISKRLGVEVRSLEAQLAYADRQLRQKLLTEDTCAKCEKKEETIRRIFNESRMSSSSFTLSSNSEHSLVETSEEREALGNVKLKGKDKFEQPLQDDDELKRVRQRSALYQTSKNDPRLDVNEKRRSTVGGTFLVVDQFTTQDEPTLFGCDYDWDRILELQKRNAACLPHMRSSYPVEIQVRTEKEVKEEELKSGCLGSGVSRKRHRDNVLSDSNINVAFHIPNEQKTCGARAISRSKSDDSIGKKISEKTTSKLQSLKAKKTDESRNLLSSTSSLDQTTTTGNDERLFRRESIAFNVDLSPPKKSRATLQRSIHRSFGTSDLNADARQRATDRTVKKRHGFKKFPLPRKTYTTKNDKQPLTSRSTNIP